MRRQRPVLMVAGAVACLGLSACGAGRVQVDSPRLTGTDATSCRELVDALPGRVGDQERREVRPEDAYGAAYGDPPIVLTCGVEKPADLHATSSCQTVDGVDWFVPEDQIDDDRADVSATTIGRRPYVELRIPARYRPPDAELVDVADAIKAHTQSKRPCL